MRFSTLYTFVSTALLAAAGPIRVPRQTPPVDPGLAFLTILEFGATGFYQAFVQTFNGTDFQNSGFADGQAVSDVINVIAASEASHFAVLQGLSGGGPPPNCTLDFSPALVNPVTALATARTLEYAAIASYVGVIASDPSGNNSEVFSEIMGNEARHEGFLGMLLQADPFPQSFEIGMTPSEVLTQLLPFNPSCNPALTLTPNPPLTITNNGSFTNATTLTFDLGSTPCANQTNTFCQLLTGDDTLSAAIPSQNCTLAGLDGGVLVYVTSDSTQISADPLQRGNISNLCAGPAVIFVDPVTSPPLDALLLQPASTSSNSTA